MNLFSLLKFMCVYLQPYGNEIKTNPQFKFSLSQTIKSIHDFCSMFFLVFPINMLLQAKSYTHKHTQHTHPFHKKLYLMGIVC